jgi:short-subunit dehydrogenase
MLDLARELVDAYGIEVIVEGADLGHPGGAEDLFTRVNNRSANIDVLVNNAGFGIFGEFLDNDILDLRKMLQVDIISLTDLTLLFARKMKSRGIGNILLVSSMAAYQPTPLYAAYGAAKAYVLSLGEALHVELAPEINVAVLSPGLMNTGFLAVSGQIPSKAMTRNMITPEMAAKIGLEALFTGKSSVIPGRLNNIAAFANRFTSRKTQAKFIKKIQQ